MAPGYLIDTNVIIDFAADRLPVSAHDFITGVIDDNPSISIINKIELLGFSNVPKAIKEFIEITDVFALDESIARQTVLLRRNYRIKLPDAIIAATAIVNDLVLLTRNTKDFKPIKELQVKDPYRL